MPNLVNFSLGDVGGLFTSLREAITGKKIEDPNELAKVQAQIDALENAVNQGQIETDKVEAASPNWFVAGWRPFIGWIGGISFLYQFVIYPFLVWGSVNFGIIAPPQIDSSVLNGLVTSLLGLGALRTVEKYNGTNNRH